MDSGSTVRNGSMYGNEIVVGEESWPVRSESGGSQGFRICALKMINDKRSMTNDK